MWVIERIQLASLVKRLGRGLGFRGASLCHITPSRAQAFCSASLECVTQTVGAFSPAMSWLTTSRRQRQTSKFHLHQNYERPRPEAVGAG
jgi:hypothetical protein